MKKQIVITPETNEEKLQRLFKQRDDMERAYQAAGSAAMVVLGFAQYMMVSSTFVEEPTHPLAIIMYAVAGLTALTGVIAALISGKAGSYKCDVCGHVHVHADPFQILAFHLFGKKSLVCTNCNCKQPHQKLPRTRREK